jgi:hypothetical protein
MTKTTDFLDQVSAEMVDRAITLQCKSLQSFDRTKFATDVLSDSREFMEYIHMMTSLVIDQGAPVSAAICSAVALGIEIGACLKTMSEGRSA